MEPLATLSDVNCPTVVPVTSNAIFGAETPFIGLGSEEGRYSTDYSTVMRTLGPAQKAPRFCLKYTLHHFTGMAGRGDWGKPPGLSGFYGSLT